MIFTTILYDSCPYISRILPRVCECLPFHLSWGYSIEACRSLKAPKIMMNTLWKYSSPRVCEIWRHVEVSHLVRGGQRTERTGEVKQPSDIERLGNDEEVESNQIQSSKACSGFQPRFFLNTLLWSNVGNLGIPPKIWRFNDGSTIEFSMEDISHCHVYRRVVSIWGVPKIGVRNHPFKTIIFGVPPCIETPRSRLSLSRPSQKLSEVSKNHFSHLSDWVEVNKRWHILVWKWWYRIRWFFHPLQFFPFPAWTGMEKAPWSHQNFPSFPMKYLRALDSLDLTSSAQAELSPDEDGKCTRCSSSKNKRRWSPRTRMLTRNHRHERRERTCKVWSVKCSVEEKNVKCGV